MLDFLSWDPVLRIKSSFELYSNLSLLCFTQKRKRFAQSWEGGLIISRLRTSTKTKNIRSFANKLLKLFLTVDHTSIFDYSWFNPFCHILFYHFDYLYSCLCDYCISSWLCYRSTEKESSQVYHIQVTCFYDNR